MTTPQDAPEKCICGTAYGWTDSPEPDVNPDCLRHGDVVESLLDASDCEPEAGEEAPF